MPETTLQLPVALRTEIASRSRDEYPNEACGLLVGFRDGRSVRVVEVVATRNLAARSDRFAIDPADWLAAHDAGAARGLGVVGIWHTHPDRPAEPSVADAEAAWDGYCYVIASVSPRGVEDIRCWRRMGGAFTEQRIRQSA